MAPPRAKRHLIIDLCSDPADTDANMPPRNVNTANDKQEAKVKEEQHVEQMPIAASKRAKTANVLEDDDTIKSEFPSSPPWTPVRRNIKQEPEEAVKTPSTRVGSTDVELSPHSTMSRFAKPGVGGFRLQTPVSFSFPNRSAPSAPQNAARRSVKTKGTPGTPLTTTDKYQLLSCHSLYYHYGQIKAKLSVNTTRTARGNSYTHQRMPITGETVTIVDELSVQFSEVLFVKATKDGACVGEIDAASVIEKDLRALLKSGHSISGTILANFSHALTTHLFYTIRFSTGECNIKYRFIDDEYTNKRVTEKRRPANDAYTW
ncbi:hypothetical protein BJ508DRAFT_327225 [Ascobolus immersus RN42]|uniref:Uncharacterized protein n=1 Tax=Ascobolus immersus RN42 TaxID=1160509 RepID=A0A3N4IFP7_ASCIM|nr:hypothetical protein BJ508DRAFT_327225 [Ascobolus immersus RN42]